MNKDEGVPPPGDRGPSYIAPSNEHGPSDQTDLNRTVFLIGPDDRAAPCPWDRLASRSFPWLLEYSR